MQRLGPSLCCVLVVLVGVGLASPLAAQSVNFQQGSPSSSSYASSSWWDDPTNWIQQFVPADREFWESSKFWTTNYGPAFRDVVEKPSNFLGCTAQFALCFHSGAQPYPCTLSPDGRSADCVCTVSTQTNYVTISSILNYSIYQQTVQQSGADGSLCPNVDQAPVCNYLNGWKTDSRSGSPLDV
jgi:hypothetical protein